ncbi:MAG: Hsp20 family protein [Gammaproteobacteria bacterium]|nr:Hsp20 family protein [Pseudomonadales bacterium]
MRTFDFSPLYRSTVGFDNLTSLLDSVSQWDKNQPSYPPYNIELVEEDHYRITMAVAGFVQDELDIQVEKQTLTVRGNRQTDDESRTYLHRGIAGRNFERHFRLADHVKVSGARLENGLLHIDLRRELPESMKPRSIEIKSADPRLIDVDSIEKDQAA